MTTPLRIVTPETTDAAAPTAISLSVRILQLQAEARKLAGDHVETLRTSLMQTQRIADEIAEGGEAYPPGVRDIARRLSEDNAARALTLETLMGRL